MKTILFLLLALSGPSLAQAADYSCALPEGEWGLAASTNFDLLAEGDSYALISNVGQRLGVLDRKTNDGQLYWQSANGAFTLVQSEEGKFHFYAGQFYLCEEI